MARRGLTEEEVKQALESLRTDGSAIANPENWHEPIPEETQTTAEVLTAARKLIADPNHWTTGYWTYSPETEMGEEGEIQWNVLDAVRCATLHGGDYTEAILLLEEIIEDRYFPMLPADFFAIAAHDVVMDVFYEAIRKADEEQGLVAGVGVEPT